MRTRILRSQGVWSLAGTLLLSTLAATGSAGAEPPAAKADESKTATKGQWYPVFERHARDYAITLGDLGKEATRLPEPVLRWWQPVRGGDDGALYLWVKDGKPVAAITFFTFRWERNGGERVIVHEHHSFAQEPVEGRWLGKSLWHTTSPGVKFRPIEGASAPAQTAQARLRQMQGFVRDFTAQTMDDKGSTWTLRPLTKPLHRYEGTAAPLFDGALFAFAQGTDPEAFLLIEARGQGKESRWEYAVARFTDLKIEIKYKGREVYSGKNTIGGPGEVYQSTIVLARPSDLPRDFEQP